MNDQCWCGRAFDDHDETDEHDHNPNTIRPTERYAEAAAQAAEAIASLPEWMQRNLEPPTQKRQGQ